MQKMSKRWGTGLKGVWERYWLVFVIVAILVVAVTYWPRPEPEPLVFVVLPAEESSLTKEQFAPLVEYLSDGLGTEVELMTVTDYTAVIEALKYGHADFARLSSGAYIQATEEADVEVLAVAVKKKTGKPDYTSLIITLADSDVTDLNGVSLAYVDVGSTSGYLVPSTYIIKGGIELGTEFFAGSHSAVIEAVRNGTVDAGCIADNRYYVAIEEGVITEDDFTILWQSDPIPNAPIVVQCAMDPELRERLLVLFLDASQELVEHLGIGEISYVVAIDSDYDSIREIFEVHGCD